jgi:hypothetical protein
MMNFAADNFCIWSERRHASGLTLSVKICSAGICSSIPAQLAMLQLGHPRPGRSGSGRCPLSHGPENRRRSWQSPPDEMGDNRTSDRLFNHLVGGHLHDLRHSDVQRLGGLEVDHELEFGGLHNR